MLLDQLARTKPIRGLKKSLRERSAPQHIAFLMDGNRRWARRAGYVDECIGHEFGATRAEQVLRWCAAADIRYVTVYVASLDNLRKRSAAEVGRLMELIERVATKRLEQRDCRLHVAGHLDALPPRTAELLRRACEVTATISTEFHLTAAIAYDGHTEIVDAVRSLLRQKAKDDVTLQQISETITAEDISKHLYVADLPDPEIVVRTSGELRLSAFMPWQTAYSRLYFSAAYWPELKQSELLRVIRSHTGPRTKWSAVGHRKVSASSAYVDRLCRLFPSMIERLLARQIAALNRPRHVAVILTADVDLKTRACKESHVSSGFDMGVSSLISWCFEFQIEMLTICLPGSKAPTQYSVGEVSVFSDLSAALVQKSKSSIKPRLRLLGQLHLLPPEIASKLRAVVAQTENNKGLQVNIAVCNDGRSEVVLAVKQVLRDHANRGRSIEDTASELQIDHISQKLEIPSELAPDLIIRTSSDPTLDGLLLWHAVRAEFWFLGRHIRKFQKIDFMQALRDYGGRSRRFGA